MKQKRSYCDPCKTSFSNPSGLTRHLKTITHINVCKKLEIKVVETKKKYICNPCNFSTDRKDKYDLHITSFDHIIKIFNSLININLLCIINGYLAKYSCIPCKYFSPILSLYNEHCLTDKHFKIIKQPIPQKKFKCPTENCNSSFNKQSDLDIHMNGVTHGMTVEEKKEFNIKRGHESNKKGFINEKYVFKLMKKFDNIEKVKSLGNTGNIYDIKYKINNEEISRYLQVKTIGKTKLLNSYKYSMETPNKYDNNTLLVGVDVEKKLFALVFMKDIIDIPCITYYPNSVKSSQNKFFYTDKKKFLKELKEKIILSVIMSHESDGLSKTQKLEFFSLKRLKKQCLARFFLYERSLDNFTEIDCYINEYKIQHKSSTTNEFNLSKCNGSLNSKQISRPYCDQDDVDFFIFESINDENINNFFIIPMDKMIKYGYIKTDLQKGMQTITLPIIRDDEWTKSNHWSMKYLNNFDQLSVDFD